MDRRSPGDVSGMSTARTPDSGPWDGAGNVRLPGWIEAAGPMPETWPVMLFWAGVGKAELAKREESE